MSGEGKIRIKVVDEYFLLKLEKIRYGLEQWQYPYCDIMLLQSEHHWNILYWLFAEHLHNRGFNFLPSVNVAEVLFPEKPVIRVM